MISLLKDYLKNSQTTITSYVELHQLLEEKFEVKISIKYYIIIVLVFSKVN